MPVTSFKDIMSGLDWSYIVKLLLSIIPALLCLTIHEACHGLAALAMGDHTAEMQKRLSLNPLRHIDPFGLIMLIVFKVGWAKPVQVNMMNFRHPKSGMAITALAGPVSNMIFAALILFVRGMVTAPLYRVGWGETALEIFDMTAYLSLSLGLFNLIPIPPLDGSKVLFALLPDRDYMKLMRYERYGMILIIVIMLSGVISTPLSNATYFLYQKLTVVAQAGYNLVN